MKQAIAQIEALTEKAASANKQLRVKPTSAWGYSFYFYMSLLVAVVVVCGFSRTVGPRLFHPPSPRPPILYFHGVLFAGWVVFFILQSALIRTRNVNVHRKVGWFGLALGIAIPIVGVATTLTMTKLHIQEGVVDAPSFMAVPLFDMLAFSVTFALAFYWRKEPEFHRRLMLMATCALTAAAFGRLIPLHWFYAGVDVLILLGVVRDAIATKRIHPVYLYGLPLLMLGQTVTIYAVATSLPEWLKIARSLLG